MPIQRLKAGEVEGFLMAFQLLYEIRLNPHLLLFPLSCQRHC